ncbi:protein shisa-4 [Larimichthys crocea]|uniref:protein shisa-4 n=1 Tax=Larimichthys crocea TaxID=215358 RepID=UPI000901B8F2|nr:protein shisa-4 [Larimichthys crocea]
MGGSCSLARSLVVRQSVQQPPLVGSVTVGGESNVFLTEPGVLEVAMASGLSGVVVLVLCVTLAPCVSAGSKNCQSYTDITGEYHSSKSCWIGFCCGTCSNRYCCQDTFMRLSEDQQEDCEVFNFHSPMPMILGISGFAAILLIFICCCVCPCCCLYKMCRKPRPVIATTTHTTVVTNAPQQYPQQPTAVPGPPHSYQGSQYPQYQPVPVQPGYGAQPMLQGYGAQPMAPSPYQGQPFTPGPPPTYQEATGPYPPEPMPYSQAAYAPGQPLYPPQPPVQPQPNAPPARPDYLAQPAYNPDFVAPPPKTG